MQSIGLGHHYFKFKDLKPKGFRQSSYTLLLGTLVISILSLALPIMTLQVYDRILPNPGTGTLPVLIVGVCLAVFLEAVLRLCRAFVIGRSGAAYEHRMACMTMQKILNADLSKMGSYGIGEHLHRMASVGKLKDFYNGHSLTVFAELIFVPLFFGLIVYIGGPLALIPASILIVFVIVSLWRGHRLREALRDREQADDKRFNFLIESLEGVHTLKAFALEKFFERRYEALEEHSSIENYNVTQETAKTFNMSAIFSHMMVAAVISGGAWFVLNGHLTTGALIATLLLSGRMMQPIQKALSLWTRYQDFILAKDHILEVLHTPQIQRAPRPERPEAGITPLPDGKLEVKNITFTHKNMVAPIIHHLDLSLKQGDCILLSGAHGSGKTTFLNLITGLFPTDEGEILIDNQLINTYKPEDLVRHIGYIRTNALIFRGSIRDNITCFGQVPERQAQDISALLHVDQDIAKLPSGFDTFLNGNNSDAIPPGLKQRIAIVRVLASKPKIIVFDNADRSLDKDGYASIYSLLARLKGQATMILISDDLNIRGLADRHYILEDGQLTHSGDAYSKGNVRPYKELRL